MNNYQPNTSFGFGSLINTGGTSLIPASGSDDAKLLNQQNSYAAQCSNFIGSVSAIRNGVDLTAQKQAYLLSILSTTIMTLAQARSYFPSVTSAYWSNNVIDYLAALAAIQSAAATF
jgi:hypothetical protein